MLNCAGFRAFQRLGGLSVNLEYFKQFVAENIDWFRGRLPESADSLARYEAHLGRCFPQSIKWLLTTHGYWHGTGIANLEEAVQLTLDCRDSIELPHRYVVLNDHGDGGVIVLDTDAETSAGEMRIHNVEAEELHGLDGRDIPLDIVYESFGEYVADVLKTERYLIDPADVKYDPVTYGD